MGNNMNSAYILLIISAVIWGGVFHVIKYPLAVAPPFVLLIARFTLTAIILLPFLIKDGDYRLVFSRRNFASVLLLSIVGICGYNIFFTYGMQLSDAATGSLIIAANPVMTTLLARCGKRNRFLPCGGAAFCSPLSGSPTLSFRDVLIMLCTCNWGRATSFYLARRSYGRSTRSKAAK